MTPLLWDKPCMKRSLLLAAVLVACTKDEPVAPPPEPDPRPNAPPEWDRAVSRTDEATASAARAACTYGPGALPDETLGRELPTGDDIPIETIVVLMQENRSFDHYFGRFGKYAGRTDVEGPPEGATNPERSGPSSSATYAFQHAAHLCFTDTAHSWKAVRKQINGGLMDGFFETNHDATGGALGHGERAMWFYDERDIPGYYALAKAFGLGDHYFSSVPGPTYPNHMYLYAGTSFGLASNGIPDLSAYPFPEKDVVILDELEKRHVDFKVYSNGGPPGIATVLSFQIQTRYGRDIHGTIQEFMEEAAAGTLPAVAFVVANALKTDDVDGDNEHPPQQIQIGQKFSLDLVNALFKSPQWPKTALFINYDEHGGLYDHVPPPKACPPDDLPPRHENGELLEGAFDTLGVRVPLLVVSPYAKRGHVSHHVYDHTSILRFIQAKHRVPALTKRDANALPPFDFFDFSKPPDLSTPVLPEPVVDEVELAYCKQTFR